MKNFNIYLYVLSFIFLIAVFFSFYFILNDNQSILKNNDIIFSDNRSLAYNLDREQ
jgi:hypothetical protein